MPRPDVSDRRRTRILTVARKTLASKPLKHVKMQDIARTSGLSVGGVYWYFKSKEEILSALLLQNAERNIILINRLIETNAPTTQRIQIIIEHLIDQVSNLSELYLMGAKYHAMLSHVPETQIVVDQIYAGYRKGLTTLIEQGISCGEFRPVDARNVAITMIGAFEGLMLLWVTSPQSIHLKESTGFAVQLLLKGLVRD